MSRSVWTVAVVLACGALPAAAGDETLVGTRSEGEARVGWRFVHDEDEGRFPQDEGLQDGPRLFDLRYLWNDDRPGAALEELEASMYGVGDRSSDYDLVLRKSGLYRLQAGFRRDGAAYRATGDPFAYDTTHERTFFRARTTPTRNVAVRLEFERATRRGEAFTGADTDLREVPAPAGVDDDLVRERRPIDRRFDTYLVGVDFGAGIWRAGLTETVRVGVVDDERLYDIPAARRGSDPIRETLRRQLRSRATTTTAKAGVSPWNGNFDLNLIGSHTRLPVDGRVSGDARGFDNAFSGGTPKGAFAATLDGENRIRRTAVGWRAEALWRPLESLELVAGTEQDDLVDDASLRLEERRRYQRADVAAESTRRDLETRTTDRSERVSYEASWDVTDAVRVRLGQEFLEQDLEVPTETRGKSLQPTRIRSSSTRRTVGLDVRPYDRLHLHVLFRQSDNDDPHAVASTENADEVSYRGRWRASDALFVSLLYRLKDYHHSRQFSSSTRSEVLSGTVSWNSGPWSVSSTTAFHDFETRTGTSFFTLDGFAFTQVRGSVRFDSRDLTETLEASYRIDERWRTSADLNYVRTRGDYEARHYEASLGLEFDVRADLTLGAAARVFEFDEKGPFQDDYGVQALELWLTYRF